MSVASSSTDADGPFGKTFEENNRTFENHVNKLLGGDVVGTKFPAIWFPNKKDFDATMKRYHDSGRTIHFDVLFELFIAAYVIKESGLVVGFLANRGADGTMVAPTNPKESMDALKKACDTRGVRLGFWEPSERFPLVDDREL